MMKQTTFASLAWDGKKKTTKRELFLKEMNLVVPWTELCAVIEPYYPKGENGRPPKGLERMLRIYFTNTIRNIRYVALMLVLACLAGCKQESHPPLPTVPSVDLRRYMGDWYEIALLPNSFQSMCVADTKARYWLDGDRVRVKNSCRKTDETMAEASGIANVVEGSRNAKLRVSFFRPFYGDYWILALDPEYRWVLVGEPSRKYGWVLSRQPVLEAGQLQSILDTAESLGYERSAFVSSPHPHQR